MTVAYSKPFKTVAEQIELLRSRGMDIGDEATATRYLQNVGYYRLSGYWYPYRREVPIPTTDPRVLPNKRVLSTFTDRTEFSQVRNLYEFDRRLKLLVLDGIERVEVSMRFQLGHTLGEGHPFAHCDIRALSPAFTGVSDFLDPLANSAWLSSEHAKWLSKIRGSEKNSKEEFVKHFKEKYGDGLPVWVVTEILDFGGMSTLYSGLKPNQRDQIAEHFGFTAVSAGDGKTLAGWMVNLNYVRNICAHHARLWNKNMAVQGPELTRIADLAHAEDTKSRVYSSLAVIAYMLGITNPDSCWRQDLVGFIGPNAADVDLAKMGFPKDWQDEPIWSPVYAPAVDLEKVERNAIRRKFECMRTSDVGQTLFSGLSAKEAATEVRRLRSRSDIFGLQLEEGAPFDFPVFQLDLKASGVHPLVAYTNRRIGAKDHPWGAAAWWLDPLERLSGKFPLEVFEAGALNEALIDELTRTGLSE